jgi:hypothetical protein
MSKSNIKLTIEEYIYKCNIIHKNKYDYSLTSYKNSEGKVIVICPTHGQFVIRASNHKRGVGCKKCADELNRYNRLDTEEFIKRSKNIHGDTYDYSVSNYIGIHTNIEIICKEHGIFEQLPNNHFKKLGCPKCSGIKRLDTDEFITKSKDVHGDKYDYSLVNYINNRTKVNIICIKHGIFSQSPSSHINNSSGCPYCCSSKGENLIKNYLNNININYIHQHKFADCKDKKILSYDFYLPDYNLCIEYDGLQHFKPIKRFGGLEGFNIVKKHDKIKNIYCKSNDIMLLRIKYNDNIEKKLKNFKITHDTK